MKGPCSLWLKPLQSKLCLCTSIQPWPANPTDPKFQAIPQQRSAMVMAIVRCALLSHAVRSQGVDRAVTYVCWHCRRRLYSLSAEVIQPWLFCFFSFCSGAQGVRHLQWACEVSISFRTLSSVLLVLDAVFLVYLLLGPRVFGQFSQFCLTTLPSQNPFHPLGLTNGLFALSTCLFSNLDLKMWKRRAGLGTVGT